VTVHILGKEVIIRMGFLEMGSSVLVREGRVLEGKITGGSIIVVMFAGIMVSMVITTLIASLQIIMQMLGLVLVMVGMLLLPLASLTFSSGW
jgi:protein-S-isoprenylcysteine O-methyltransferase Ste14